MSTTSTLSSAQKVRVPNLTEELGANFPRLHWDYPTERRTIMVHAPHAPHALVAAGAPRPFEVPHTDSPGWVIDNNGVV